MASRGAQPGNTNALKHGFYARKFSKAEHLDIEAYTAALTDEIAMLRVAARRLFEFSNGIDDKDNTLDSFVATTNALGMIAIRIAHITRTQNLLAGGDGGTNAIITDAINQAVKEFNLDV